VETRIPVTNSKGKSGFVLIAAIWLAGLIAALTASFAVKVRVDTLAASNLLHNGRAELIADGMARLAAWRLANNSWAAKADGTEVSCRWEKEAEVTVAVQDQAGLVDLNSMPDAFFAELFERLGTNRKTAIDISQALQDYRDVDSNRVRGGTEPSTYDGESYGPKNAPFQAIEELDQVPGITPELYRAALNLVTVYAVQPGIDATTAPPKLRELFNEKSEGDFTSALAGYAAAPQASTMAIDVKVELANGARFRRKAIAVALQQPDRPFLFLEWQRGADWAEPASESPALNTCIN
jgi:general secretion pathway protein K